MFLLVFYFAFAVIASFLCSLLESVILSTPYSHAQALSRKGAFYAPLLKKLKSQLSASLSAILTVNTIANTLGAAGAGAQVLKLYGSQYVAIAAAALTFVILIVSEIIPKTIGATYWRSLLPLRSTPSAALFLSAGLLSRFRATRKSFLGRRPPAL